MQFVSLFLNELWCFLHSCRSRNWERKVPWVLFIYCCCLRVCELSLFSYQRPYSGICWSSKFVVMFHTSNSYLISRVFHFPYFLFKSGAILGLIAMTIFRHPEFKLHIIFLPMFPIPAPMVRQLLF